MDEINDIESDAKEVPRRRCEHLLEAAV